MNSEEMNLIKNKMQECLLPEQMKKLEAALSSMLEDDGSKSRQKIERKNLIKQFIAAKRIEGCSKRTEEYYFTTLRYFQKTIKCNVCSVTTETIREYLINYQKLNNCSNVTLDTVFGSGEKSHVAPVGKSQILTNEKNQNYPSYTSFLE